MFASPLIRWFRLVALVLLAVAVALTGIAGEGLGQSIGVAGVLLLAATVVGMVRGAGAFDERAFHRTRPGGESRVFVRQTLWLVLLPLSVGLVAVAWGWWWNLGWRCAFWSGTVAFVPLLMFSAAVATGVVLGTGRSRRVGWVVWLMAGLPLAVYVWMAEARHSPSGPFPEGFDLWIRRIDIEAIVAVIGIGYCLAWCLAAACRRWKSALVVATAAGMCLPLLAFRSGRSLGSAHELSERVPVSVTIKRAPLNQIAAREGGARVPWNWLDVSGVREDEILRLGVNVVLPDGGGVNAVRDANMFGSSKFFSGRTGIGVSDADAEAQCGLLPVERIRNVSKWCWFSRMWEFGPANYDDLKRGDWLISWEIVRPAHVGSVSLAAGGRLELPAGGVFKVDPVRQHASGIEIRTFEIYPTEDRWGASAPWPWPRRPKLGVIVVSGDGRKAVVLSSIHVDPGVVEEGAGLGTRWIRKTIDFRWRARDGHSMQGAENDELGPEDLQGARIHVLDMRAGREEGRMTLPAPGS